MLTPLAIDLISLPTCPIVANLLNPDRSTLLNISENFSALCLILSKTLSKFVFDNTHRSPMIIPVVLNRRNEDDPKGISFKKKRV